MQRILILLLLVTLPLAAFAGATGEGAAAEEVVFTIANGTEPESLDPALVSGVPEHRIYMALFEGLVSYDPETAEPIPAIAESWSASSDGKTYTFKLRDAQWSDGTPVTAQQFVGSWTRFLDPETAAPYAWMPSMVLKGASEFNSGDAGEEILGFQAIDDKTLQVELTGPAPYVVGMMAHYAFAVHPLHTIAEHGDQWTLPENLVTNGPFVLEQWSPQEQLVVRKSATYWDAANVELDKIVFIPVDDNNTMYNMFLNGEVDWATTVPLDQIDAAKVRDDYQATPQLGTYYYILNAQRPPLDDARVRKALSMVLDRDELVTRITRGGQVPAYAMTPPMAGYSTPTGNRMDVAAAQQLLADAGFPNGQGMRPLTILYNTSEAHKKIAEYIQQTWDETLGVQVELENQEWSTYLSTRRGGDYDISRAGWIGDYLDPNTFLELFVSASTMDGGAYQNPAFDRLIERAPTIGDPEQRLQALRQAEELLVSQDQGVMPIYYYMNIDMIDTNTWGGWHGNTLGNHPWKFIHRK